MSSISETARSLFARVRRKRAEILLVVVSTLLALIVAEIALRVMQPSTTIPDAHLGHRMRQNFEFDAQGFRNPKVLTHARIVALGDSQTEGNNATSGGAWPYALSRIENKSVYNMAVSGYSPVQYAYLLDQALELKPDVVLVGLYVGNDLADVERIAYALPAWESLRDPEYRVAEAVTDPTQDFRTVLGSGVVPGSLDYHILKIRTWIRANVRIYALLGNASRGVREWVGVARTNEEKQDDIRSIAREFPEMAYVYDTEPEFETVLSPSYRRDPINLDHPPTQEGWRITQMLMKEMHARAQSAHIPVVFVVIPTKEKVYLEYMRASDGEIPDIFIEYDDLETRLLITVTDFCATEQLLCTQTLPSLVSGMQDGRMVYGRTMDGHPKAEGYQVIAEHVARYLAEHNLFTSQQPHD